MKAAVCAYLGVLNGECDAIILLLRMWKNEAEI